MGHIWSSIGSGKCCDVVERCQTGGGTSNLRIQGVVRVLPAKESVHHFHSRLLHVGCHVSIDAKRNGDVGVPQHLTHYFWVHPSTQQERCCSVAQIMKTHIER